MNESEYMKRVVGSLEDLLMKPLDQEGVSNNTLEIKKFQTNVLQNGRTYLRSIVDKN